MAHLHDVTAGHRVKVGASVVESSLLGDDVEIGHFDRVRPDSKLGDKVSLGTHAEVKNSTIGAGSRISHFSCVLDSEVGEDVNVGAGTVTCNYDGRGKARTIIGDRVFVGTNSTLIAPVELAADSYIAAGSVINEDVPAYALGVGRARQRNVEGWTKRGH
jgi:bifunctional UDP-N-acetylglucosamine pyrophosphorylase/glucosamine-1-phosphate N-acetyltransferase